MTKELLKQYRWLALEIAIEQARLEALDRGSAPSDPERRQELEAKIRQAEEQCAEVEGWIVGISDKSIQKRVILRYVDGLRYKEIAEKVGRTPAAVRKSLYRFFQAQEVL